MLHNFRRVDKEGDEFIKKSRMLMEKISSMSLLLIKMAVQCSDFMLYSQPILVISAIYASTAFLKHSSVYQGSDCDKFINEVRKIIFQVIGEEKNQHMKFIPQTLQDYEIPPIPEQKLKLYQCQFNAKFIEKLTIDLVHFEKNFDTWHCG